MATVITLTPVLSSSCGVHSPCCYQACTRIPQMGHNPKAQEAALANSRSCVRSYPTRQCEGVVWVWAESGPHAAAEAAAASLPIAPEMQRDVEGAEWEDATAWFSRLVPVNFDTVLENVSDPW